MASKAVQVVVESPKGLVETFSASFGNQTPLVIKAQSNQSYEFLNAGDSDLSERIITKKSKEDLLLYFEEDGELVSSIIIQDYFLYPNQQFIGLGSGQLNESFDTANNIDTPVGSSSYEPLTSHEIRSDSLPGFFSAHKLGFTLGGLVGLGIVASLGGASDNNDSSSSSTANNPASITVTGTPNEGKTLTANISDPNGIPVDSIVYQWLREGENIAGATSSTYVLAQDDVGKTVSVTASFTDDDKNFERITSEATEVVVNTNDLGELEISGDLTQGQIIKAELVDEDGLPESSDQVIFTWFANNVMISSDTSDSLKLTQNEVGKFISVKAEYTDSFGQEESVESSLSQSSVANVNDPGIVAIVGELIPGQTLEAQPSDLDGIRSFSLRYQWYADDSVISGANASKYTLTNSELGKSMSVRVSYTDNYNAVETASSLPTQEVGTESSTETSAKILPEFTLADIFYTSEPAKGIAPNSQFEIFNQQDAPSIFIQQESIF